MIEAPEYVTPTQRKLHDQYQRIHERFFPSPPVFAKLQPKVIAPPVGAPVIEPTRPIPEPIKAPSSPVPFDQTGLRLRIIKKIVCADFNISEQSLTGRRRTREIFLPRHMFSYLSSRFTKATLHRIGKALGGQDHTTVLHGIRGTKLRIANDIAIHEQVMRLESLLRRAFGETNTPRNFIGRYVLHHRMRDYENVGWYWLFHVNEYACVMAWPCACECVEPKDG